MVQEMVKSCVGVVCRECGLEKDVSSEFRACYILSRDWVQG